MEKPQTHNQPSSSYSPAKIGGGGSTCVNKSVMSAEK